MKMRKYLILVALLLICAVSILVRGDNNIVLESRGHQVLTGLRGVAVDTREVDFGIKRKVGLTKQVLQADVESQLCSNGIAVFSEDEVFKMSGRPHLSIQLNIGVMDKLVYYSMGIQLRESVFLFRDRKKIAGFAATTWQKNTVDVSTTHSAVEDIKSTAKYLVDSFCKDYLEANPKANLLAKERKTVATRDIKKCPYGHTELMDVPIKYGLLIGDEKTEEAIKNKEFIPGGCVVKPEKSAVVCRKCGFEYDSRENQWSRKSKELTSFHNKFSELLLRFPRPDRAMQVNGITYRQNLKDGKIIWEFMSYTSKEHPKRVLATIKNWLRRENIKCKRSQRRTVRTLDNKRRYIFEWDCKGISVKVHQEEDETSWVHFSRYTE